ncbi:methionine--tRNA ligase [Patescibacteria group bacterium]|nr:methionine--tRNA ligase [Patescibacteria group bacterium]MBU4512012.1 methionine--tRNA ligase [Patescibacteria group bacterium]MCG2693211.1 methionine--tRNA ligase [Candidatus Parcubacteria bacterium]
MEKKYITTAIPYVNAAPHIGFALELIQADVVARYSREKKEDTFFLTGVDENSLKNVQAAEKEGISTQELVDRNTQKFIDLTRTLNISNDEFIRTTSEKHKLGTQKFWQACKNDIYKKKYKGLYCVGCESFYLKKDLTNGKCPEHKTKPETVEEENYFFKLSKYQKKLEKLIESDEYQVVPQTRKNEVLNFIKNGLKDFSISRSKERAKGWGIPVPGDNSQIIYVWFDALINYISALDYDINGDKFKKFWPADIHVIGKGISRFHAIYWPAMLLSAGLPLPKKLFVHGYVNIGGEKISKSIGNTVDPFELVKKYDVDAVRYFLLREIPAHGDGDFSEERFREKYNADLSNNLGNLISRTANLIEKNEIEFAKLEVKPNEFEKQIDKFYSDFKFDEILKFIWQKIDEANLYINKKEPWKVKEKKELEKIFKKLVIGIQKIAKALVPFIPETAQKILNQFSQPKIKKHEILFPRIK